MAEVIRQVELVGSMEGWEVLAVGKRHVINLDLPDNTVYIGIRDSDSKYLLGVCGEADQRLMLTHQIGGDFRACIDENEVGDNATTIFPRNEGYLMIMQRTGVHQHLRINIVRDSDGLTTELAILAQPSGSKDVWSMSCKQVRKGGED